MNDTFTHNGYRWRFVRDCESPYVECRRGMNGGEKVSRIHRREEVEALADGLIGGNGTRPFRKWLTLAATRMKKSEFGKFEG